MFCQRADVRQRQLPFAAQNHRTQRAVNVQQPRQVRRAQVVRVQEVLQGGQPCDFGCVELRVFLFVVLTTRFSGIPRAFEADGQTSRVGKDGVTPMTLAEWVDALVSDAPHLFEANAGGGAAGSGFGGAGNRSVKNPFAKATWNLTEQMKLQKSDPQL